MNHNHATETIGRARAAQIDWTSRKVSERVRVLKSLRKQIVANREMLVTAITSDTGKPPLDALGGDILVTLEQMRFYERRAAKLLASRTVGRSRLLYASCRFREHFEPHGTVLVFGPANYPVQLSLIPATTALYAGNSVVLKVSEKTPSVARAIEDLISKSGLPANLLQVVCASPREAVDLIDAKPDFVFFTGSTINGKAVAARAAALGIPTLLELGGSDPAVVFDDCDFDRTLEGVTYGAFSNAGQVCVGIKRLLIQQPVYEHFLDALVRRVAQLRLGSGSESDFGQLPNQAVQSLLDDQVHDAISKGARLETPVSSAGCTPVILSNVPPDARLMREEAFGPVLCVRSFATEQEAIELANTGLFALGASVWTRNFERGRRVALALRAGNCSINDVIRNIANPYAAFGGNAASGYGRYHGPHGLYAFSRVKTVMENRSSRRTEINWFPLTRKKYDALCSLIELRHRPVGIMAALRRAMHLTAFAGILSTSTLQAQAAHLLLQVRLPAGAHGRVAYLVFNSAEGFPQDKTKALVHGYSAPVGNGSLETIDVGELPPGRYAASVYLDENDNGKLDSKIFGIPKEPVGASNNPRRRMGPPRFEDCVFNMSTSKQTISITLVRP